VFERFREEHGAVANNGGLLIDAVDGLSCDHRQALERGVLPSLHFDGRVITSDEVERIHKEVRTSRMLTCGHHEDRTPRHGYEATRQPAMQAFARSWHRET
jgi:hypothetical protein